MLRIFQKKQYNHKIEVLYVSLSVRKKYEGPDEQEAERVYNDYRARALTINSNVYGVTWYRNDVVHKNT